MEFPFGHRNRHTHRDDERNEERGERYLPPPDFRDEPRYPEVTHLHHTSHEDRYSDPTYRRPPPPQPDFYDPGFPPPQPDFYDPAFAAPPSQAIPPGYTPVQHVSHEINQGFQPYPPEIPHETHHHHHHLPSFLHHHTHQGPEFSNKPTVRVYTRAETGYSLTIRDDKVILARSDENDYFQHWIKDEKYSTRVKDEEGFPSFALINKATGQAMKHSIGATHPVQLIPYNPDVLDESVLWTESKDLGDGYRTIRMVNNIRLNLDAFHGDENHGGVHDGTILVLWEWAKGANQRWKIVPY